MKSCNCNNTSHIISYYIPAKCSEEKEPEDKQLCITVHTINNNIHDANPLDNSSIKAYRNKHCLPKQSPASTSRASSPGLPSGIACGGLSSHGGPDLLPGLLLPCWCQWYCLWCHLGQLLGQGWPRWPPHLLQYPCLLSPPLQSSGEGRALEACASASTWPCVFTCCPLFHPLWEWPFVLAMLEWKSKQAVVLAGFSEDMCHFSLFYKWQIFHILNYKWQTSGIIFNAFWRGRIESFKRPWEHR